MSFYKDKTGDIKSFAKRVAEKCYEIMQAFDRYEIKEVNIRADLFPLFESFSTLQRQFKQFVFSLHKMVLL